MENNLIEEIKKAEEKALDIISNAEKESLKRIDETKNVFIHNKEELTKQFEKDKENIFQKAIVDAEEYKSINDKNLEKKLETINDKVSTNKESTASFVFDKILETG